MSNTNKGASGMIVMLQMISQMIPVETQIEEVEDSLREYKIIPNEENKKQLMSKIILLLTTLKNEGQDIINVMKEAMDLERKAEAFEGFTKPFDAN